VRVPWTRAWGTNREMLLQTLNTALQRPGDQRLTRLIIWTGIPVNGSLSRIDFPAERFTGLVGMEHIGCSTQPQPAHDHPTYKYL
jgi:hypothetical protein